MVNRQYTAGESLNNIRLRMIYDSSKTLNENKRIVNEQSNGDLEYFETAVESTMKYPNQVSKLNFGSPTIDVEKAANAIKIAVDGVGTGFEGLTYVLDKGFTNISNSMGIIKFYPSIGNESLYDALTGEIFAGGSMSKIVTKVAGQLMEWCKTKQKHEICIPKSKTELKYGKI